MHRKLVVVDGLRAFVGGINYSADHLADCGPLAKQDYAVEITGPLVGQIRAFCHAGLHTPQPTRRSWLQHWRQQHDREDGGVSAGASLQASAHGYGRVTGWFTTLGAGIVNIGTSATEGSQAATFAVPVEPLQSLGVTLQANTRYTLQVDVGDLVILAPMISMIMQVS